MKRMVLAYAGRADAPGVIRRLEVSHGADIVALTLDIGQGQELSATRDRAVAEGAVRAHVLDVREEFARDFVLPALRAGAERDECVPLSEALGRAVVAARLVEIARMEQADAVAFGGARDGRREGPLDVAIRSLDPALEIVHVPPADGVPGVPVREDRLDVNLWGRSLTFGDAVPEDACTLTRPLSACPDEPAVVAIGFRAGTPVAINGVEMGLVELIASLDAIAGAHGVGRLQSTSSAAGAIVEAPAATLLHTAHRLLQAQLTPPDLDRFSRIVAIQYADLTEQGHWFTPLRGALDAFVDCVQAPLTGEVPVQLLKGECRIGWRAGQAPPLATAMDPHLVTT